MHHQEQNKAFDKSGKNWKIPRSNKINSTFLCDNCPNTFENKSNFEEHKKLLHKVITFTCNLCGYIFEKEFNIKEHMIMVHNRKVDKNEDPNLIGFENNANLKNLNHEHVNLTSYHCKELDNLDEYYDKIIEPEIEALLRKHGIVNNDFSVEEDFEIDDPLLSIILDETDIFYESQFYFPCEFTQSIKQFAR